MTTIHTRRRAGIRLAVAALAAGGLVTTQGARAQSQAENDLASAPFRIVAPFPPGGPIDTLARLLATGLQEKYRQAAVVDNRTGANGNLGIDAVKRAAPDGHTLLVVPAGNLTINPTLMPKLGYSVDTDFAPIAMLAKAPNVLAVNPSVPAKTVQELVALSKAKPDSLGYATPGVGSGLHLAGELFKQQSGADLLHVPYKGSAPALNDVLGGQVAVIIANLPAAMPHIQSGRLRALAVTDAVRAPALPNVPTLGEAGVAGVAVTSWYGLLAPRGTPPAVVSQLARDATQILERPATRAELQAQGLVVSITTEGAFAEAIRQETATWARIIKARNIQAE